MKRFILLALTIFSLLAITSYAQSTCTSPGVKICNICYDCGVSDQVCPTTYGVACPTSGSRCDPDCGTCITYTCTGAVPTNAQLCSGDDAGLTANTALTVVTSCTASKCEYTCAAGYSKSGNSCVTYACTGTAPANANLCSGDDTGLTSNVASTLVTSCTASKCEYTCAAGYSKSGNSCVQPESNCADGQDNDADTLTDCRDPDCKGKEGSTAHHYDFNGICYYNKVTFICDNTDTIDYGAWHNDIGPQSAALNDNNPCTDDACTDTGVTHTDKAEETNCGTNSVCRSGVCTRLNAPPVVALSTNLGTVGGSVTFSVTASDADGDSIADIRFDLNYAGNWNNDICPGKSGASASCTWDSVAQWAATRLTPGTATLRVKATDANGAESSPVTDEFTVDNRPNAPTLTDISGYSEGGINTGSVSFQSNPAATAPAAIASVQYWIKLGSTGTWISICTAASSPWSCAWNSNTNVPTSNDQVYVKAQATESAPLGRSVEKEEGPFKVDNGCAARGDGSSCGTGAYCLSGACCGDTANERYTSITTGGICLDSTSTAPLCCGAGQVQRNGRCVEGCTETRCYDEVDNDGDGNTDCADTDCTSPIRTGATGAFCCSNTQCDNNNQCDTDTKKCISVLDPKTGNNPVCCLTYDQCIAASGTPRYPGLTPDQCVRHGVWVDGSCI